MTDTIEGLLAKAADRLAEATARISALEKTSESELSKLRERLAEVESKFESRGALVGQLLKERDECRAAAAEAALKAAERVAELEGRLVGRHFDRMFGATAGPLIEHDWRPYEREDWFVCMRCGLIRGDKTPPVCRGSLPAVELREPEASYKPHVTAEIHAGRLVVFGFPDPEDESHSCDALGCGSTGAHVLEYLSPIEAAQELYRLRARETELKTEVQTARARIKELEADLGRYADEVAARALRAPRRETP